MIYFIQAESGYIKIGFTSRDPAARLKALQTSSAQKLTLLGVMPGTQKKEKSLHLQFKDFAILGEWFMPSQQIIEFIDKNSLTDMKIDTEKKADDLELSIGSAIKTLRLKKNWPREKLCDLADVSQNALRHLENGDGASVRTLVRVARALKRQDWVLALAPQISINPLDMIHGKPRQRASKT